MYDSCWMDGDFWNTVTLAIESYSKLYPLFLCFIYHTTHYRHCQHQCESEVWVLKHQNQSKDIPGVWCDKTKRLQQTGDKTSVHTRAQSNLNQVWCRVLAQMHILIFTARCTIVHSVVLRSHVVRPSVRPSVCLTLVDQDHIGRKSWKLIARTLSLTPSLFVAQGSSTYSQGNMGKFWGD